MKYIQNEYMKWFLFVLVIVIAVGCKKQLEEANLQGKDFLLSSQAEVSAFKTTEDIRTLTITGADVLDLSMLNFKTVKNLVITKTGVKQLTLPHLTSVTVSFEIKNNEQLEAINGLDNFKFMNGNLVISNNTLLKSIAGFSKLKIFTGTLDINNNASLGENERCAASGTGFCVIKYLLDNSIFSGSISLANNHPQAVTDPSLIGVIAGGEIRSFTLASKSDIEQFAPPSDTVQNLNIYGTDVTDEVLALIKTRIKKIKGAVTIENTAITTTENFFDVIKCEGSIILKNNPQLINPNGFKNYVIVNGDLIVENCPKMFYWGVPRGQAGFSGITKIEGSLKLSPVPSMGEGGAGLTSLSYVGGSFEISGDKTKGDMWNMDTWYQLGGGIKHIGGDLIYKNHYKVNGLGGLQAIEYIGGDIYILDNGGPDGYVPVMTTPGQVGFCLVKSWVNTGILKKVAPVIQLRAKVGDPLIDIDNLQSCN